MSVASPPTAFALATGALLLVILVPATAIDRRERRIPNALTGGGAVAAVVLSVLLDPAGLPERFAGATVAVAFLLLVRCPRPDGLGLGDVKLAGVLGLCLGPMVALALLVAFAAGSVTALVVVVRAGRPALRTATVAFGPYLSAGGVAAFALGDGGLVAARLLGS